METTTIKTHVESPLARAYELQDELRLLGTTLAARDPLSAYLDASTAQADAIVALLEKLQNAVPEAR
jgi:hypothetical protein